MDTIYLASLDENSGKTLLAAVLGQRLAAQGRRVSYVKSGSDASDRDAQAMQQALGAGRQDAPETASRQDAVLLVEAPRGAFDARSVVQDLARFQGARIVLVAWYREGLSAGEVADKAIDLKGSLAGVLLNGVPKLRLHHVQTTLAPQLREAGIPVLGILPQDRVLRAATIREIAETVEGDIQLFPENADALVEHVMIGGLVLDNGQYYFNQFKNKLVVTRWDRPDLQNAAIETDTAGFLLTGGQGPIPYMQQRIQGKKIPVIVVQEGTVALASRLDKAFSRGALHPRKIARAAELLGSAPRLEDVMGAAAP